MRVDRRALRFVAIAAVVLAALSIDPNPRGPLAIAADLWLRGHDEEAARWERRAAGELRDSGIEPSSLALSLDLSPVANPGSRARLDAVLDRLARDDRAKALFRALWSARAGDRVSARVHLESRPEDFLFPRWSRLLAATGAPVAR